MKPRLIKELACLASERFQQRYIVDGTVDEYVLPEEVLFAPKGSALAAQGEGYRSQFSTEELGAIRRFVEIVTDELEKVPLDGSISNRELVFGNDAWARARRTARETLDALGVDLGEWERSEGLT